MRNMPACNAYHPDVEALAALGPRLVLAAGVESAQQVPARGARSVAEAVGVSVTEFPSDHGGFLGGEYGQHGDPAAFATALRTALGTVSGGEAAAGVEADRNHPGAPLTAPTRSLERAARRDPFRRLAGDGGDPVVRLIDPPIVRGSRRSV